MILSRAALQVDAIHDSTTAQGPREALAKKKKKKVFTIKSFICLWVLCYFKFSSEAADL